MGTEKQVSVVVKSPSELIELAIDKGGVDLEKLYKVLEFSREVEKDAARRAYHDAMATFKANAPEVVSKNKKVNYVTKTGGTVKYNHATLSNIVKAITSGLSKNGLSVSWPSKQADGKLTVTCKITHIKGHSEEFSLTGPLDDSGGKNAIQSLGSTASYLERYTLLMATGLATEDQDDDGKTAGPVEYITDKERSELTDMAVDAGASLPKLIAYLKVEDLSKLEKKDLAKAKLALAANKARKAKEVAK